MYVHYFLSCFFAKRFWAISPPPSFHNFSPFRSFLRLFAFIFTYLRMHVIVVAPIHKVLLRFAVAAEEVDRHHHR